MTVELIQPIAMEERPRFAIGGHRGRRPRRQDQQVVPRRAAARTGRRPSPGSRPTRTFTTDRQERRQRWRDRRSHPAEGLRLRGDRCLGATHRGGGHQDRRAVVGSASADGEERVRGDPFAAQVPGTRSSTSNAHAQAAHRHPRPDAEDGRRAHASTCRPRSTSTFSKGSQQTWRAHFAVSSARSWG